MKTDKNYTFVNKVLIALLSTIVLIISWVVPVYAVEKDDTIPSGISISALEKTIDEYVENHKEHTAAVSIVATKDGKTIFNKTYGYADIENQVIADTDTVFEWGSASKLLVWTSVMQLVERGQLDLDTDIREYLPQDFLKKLKYDTPISLLNLMNHNAGWQDKITDLYYFSDKEIPELRDTLQAFEPLQVYEPGTVVAYSNFGAALAGYIVEIQSGQPFYEYVNEHIFEVLEMHETSIHPSQQDHPTVAQRRNIVQGYTTSLDPITNRGYLGLYPAGSATGTAEDAAKFLMALMPAGDTMSPLFKSNQVLKEMLSPSFYYNGSSIPRIAHGFFEINHSVLTLEHGGNTATFSSKFSFDPESNVAVIVMTNQVNEWYYCKGLLDTVFGEYKPANYEGDLPNTAEVEGLYLPARRIVSGYAKIFGFLGMEKVRAIDNDSITVSGVQYEQIEPYTYIHRPNTEFIYFEAKDGIVAKMSSPYGDSLLISASTVNWINISLVFVGICLLYNMITLICEWIRLIISRMKKIAVPASTFNKYYIIINAVGFAFVVNTAILIVKTINFSTYSSIRINLILNMVFVVLAAAYMILLLFKFKNTDCSKKRKVLYILSGISAFMWAATIVGWDLYF
ncbi:CubicO group peptidase (beta-lactamase class C family) [Paenibacillus sp. DS2015]|uniref:serine hydrolase domain-containing protein n=1 Tax=Paenibacillus sp. DS2015 TaxID=3373917 RepID=UPI003D1E72F2